MEQQTLDRDEVIIQPTTEKPVTGQTLGWLLQIGLGLLLGFSALQRLHYQLPVDDISFLLASMAVLAAAAPMQFKPLLNILCSKQCKGFLLLGIVWYGLFSLLSYIHFHRYTFFETADKPQAIVIYALLALPIALLVVALTRRTKHAAATPYWGLALLTFGLWTLPYNLQFGQLPIVLLSFIIAFQAAFLARGVRVLLISITIACLELLAISLRYYIAQPSFPRFGADSLAGPSHVGHYLLLIIAVSFGSMMFIPKKSRFPAIAIIAFFVVCIFLSQTRAALIGLIAGALFIILQRPRGSKIDRRIVAGILIAAVVVIFVVTTLTIVRQPHEQRGMMLVWSMRQFVSSPLIGNGIGSWHSSYTEHMIRTNGSMIEDHLHCHNIIAEILCNTGLIGLLIFGLVLYCSAKVYIHARESLDSPSERMALVACAAGAFGYLLSLLVDVHYWYQPVMPMIPALIGTWMGYMAARDTPTVQPNGSDISKRYVFPLAVVAGLVVIAFISSKTLPILYPSYGEKLSHKWFELGNPGELPYGDIQVRAINQAGTPIEGVTMTIASFGRTCSSDKNGICLFKHIRKRLIGQDYHLTLQCNGYADRTLDFAQVEHGPTVIGLSLEPLGKDRKDDKAH